MPSLTIGELADAAGTTVETIRYYERRGLLRMPPRTAAGYRQYSQEDRWRLAFINRAKHLGFTLREIRELIGTEGPQSPQAVLSAARQKLDEVDKKARELAAFRANLARLVRTCQDGKDAECLGLGLATTS